MSALPEPLSRKLRALGVGVAAATCLCGPLFAAAADTPPAGSGQGNFETVEGRVIGADGKPTAGATVVIFREGTLQPIQCDGRTVADDCLDRLLSAGLARAKGVSGDDGRYTLQIPGGLARTDMVWAQGRDARGDSVRSFPLPIGPNYALPTATLRDIRLNHRVDFIVVVQNDGKPVAGAQVIFVEGSPQQTDARGSASQHIDITLGPRIVYGMNIAVHADGFATATWQGWLSPGTTTQVIELVRESPLTGRIKDAHGQPLAAATLKVMPYPTPQNLLYGMDPFVAVTRTDAAGEFSLDGLRAGQQYRIFIATDNLSVPNSERIFTAGSGPLDFVMNAAVPVKLAISGMRGGFPVRKPRAPMPKVPAVISESARASAFFNKHFIGLALLGQPDLVPVTRVTNGVSPAIFMEWLDPGTGIWSQVVSPRHVKVKSATRAELQFDQVPVGTIRIRAMGDFAQGYLDSVTIRAGRTNVIPMPVTALRHFRVKVVDEKGKPVSGVRVDINGDDDALVTGVITGDAGSFAFDADPLKNLKVIASVDGRIVSTTLVKGDATPANPSVVYIRLK